MTYPPGSPGYPSAQQPTTPYVAPTQHLTKLPDTGIHTASGESKLPLYLTAAVAVLGLAVYLSSFGPLFGFGSVGMIATSFALELAIVAAVAAGICAAVALLPKQGVTTAFLAVLSVLGFLLVISSIVNIPDGVSIEWGLWLVLAFSVLQAGLATTVLLYDSGVVTAPTPRPKYDQQQYGQFGGPGGYYGQPQGQHPGQPQHQHGAQQRPGYPQQYGGGYPGSGPSTGGFPPIGAQGGQQGSQESGPPTPPTGFPAYGQPQSPGAGAGPSTQPPSQSTQQPPSQPPSSTPPPSSSPQQPSSSPQSGQSPS